MLADDLTYFDSVMKIRSCWTEIMEIGPNFGYYFPQPTKTILIVKLTFEYANIKITAEQRHLQPFAKPFDTFQLLSRVSVYHKENWNYYQEKLNAQVSSWPTKLLTI